MGTVTGIMQQKSLKQQAKQREEQGNLQAKQVLDEGEKTLQAQKQIATGGGFLLDNDTSPLLVMLETERQANENALQLKKVAKQEANSLRKAGNLALLSGVLGDVTTAASIYGGKK